ncbi:MAG: GTPase ObgE [Clostridia bacterium]|nr:GTPase ObgE [Clostridia bacterium]
MFVDSALIRIKAGNGGNGCVSFHREKYIAKGGPDGGDGGKGGNVVFVVDDGLSTLADLRYRRSYQAANGGDGKSSKFHGKNAPDCVIRVPKGTLIFDANTGRLMKDMSDSEPFVAAKGGKGGFGNVHFATPVRQIPRFAKPGMPGESFDLRLELKLLADVGLAGFPNVGKSTLLSSVSAATPKIANYHFTTLQPQLGMIRIGDGADFVMADIPGLIEGASEGAGLGHDFLRHIERCRLVVQVIDLSQCEGRDYREDIAIISRELERYSAVLASRPQIWAANKCDCVDEQTKNEFLAYAAQHGVEACCISAATGEGTRELLNLIWQRLQTLPAVEIYEAEAAPTFENTSSREVRVSVQDGVYMVEGDWLPAFLNTIDPNDEESMRYFDRVLRKSGIIDRLREAGISDGDTVSIYDVEFDFVD